MATGQRAGVPRDRESHRSERARVSEDRDQEPHLSENRESESLREQESQYLTGPKQRVSQDQKQESHLSQDRKQVLTGEREQLMVFCSAICVESLFAKSMATITESRKSHRTERRKSLLSSYIGSTVAATGPARTSV
jgi:glutamate/tyrosine decarboxylase-like PLP-dependent enzyme